jgi:hypothetical protein
MKPVLKTTSIAVVIAVIAWSFVGVERIVGDHEIGVTWEPFIKHRPSLQIRFQDPGQKGLDIVPFEALPPADRAAFIEFCAIRFGSANVTQCRALIAAREV